MELNLRLPDASPRLDPGYLLWQDYHSRILVAAFWGDTMSPCHVGGDNLNHLIKTVSARFPHCIFPPL